MRAEDKMKRGASPKARAGLEERGADYSLSEGCDGKAKPTESVIIWLNLKV
jgi:hypothetical protein